MLKKIFPPINDIFGCFGTAEKKKKHIHIFLLHRSMKNNNCFPKEYPSEEV
jgi:hypothetical protein